MFYSKGIQSTEHETNTNKLSVWKFFQAMEAVFRKNTGLVFSIRHMKILASSCQTHQAGDGSQHEGNLGLTTIFQKK